MFHGRSPVRKTRGMTRQFRHFVTLVLLNAHSPLPAAVVDRGTLAAFVIKDGTGRHFGRGSLLSRKALRVSAHTPRVSRTA